MKPLFKGQLGACALMLLMSLLDNAGGQITGEQCLQGFKKGQENFILDADESVKDGATFLSSPSLNRYRDCVVACCKDTRCNVAFMQRGEVEGSINSCFLFDCLYKKKYVCRFVRKEGYLSYILDSLYESYLTVEPAPSKPKTHFILTSGDLDLHSIKQFHLTDACQCVGLSVNNDA